MKRLSLRRRSVSGVSMDGRMSEGPSTAGRVSNRTDKISLFCLTTCAGKKSSPTKIYKQKNKREKKSKRLSYRGQCSGCSSCSCRRAGTLGAGNRSGIESSAYSAAVQPSRRSTYAYREEGRAIPLVYVCTVQGPVCHLRIDLQVVYQRGRRHIQR